MRVRAGTVARMEHSDLAAAAFLGLQTAFIPRPTEYGPGRSRDVKAERDWSYLPTDIGDLATRLGA